MIATVVEALIVGAIARELHARKIVGKLAHLVLFEDRDVLRAAKDVGLVSVGPFPFRHEVEALPPWPWERWA